MSQRPQQSPARPQERPRRPDRAQRPPARPRAQAAAAARRKDRTGLYLIGGTLAVLVVIVAAALLHNTGGATGKGLTDPKALNPKQQLLTVGSAAPNFDLATVDGKRYTLAGQRGHAVVLEFFAVWCPNCQAQAPRMAQLHDAFASRGVQTLSVLANPYGKNYESSGQSDLRLADSGDINWFAQQFSVKTPIVIDARFGTVNAYGAYEYPTLYIIDAKGVIRYAHYGQTPYGTLASAMQAALRA